MKTQVHSIIADGADGTIVDIECHLSNNLPNIIIVGLANRAVDEARERIRGSFATSHITLPRKRVMINLAPADVPKADSAFDLAMAVAILAASQQISVTLEPDYAFIGELGLDGSTRAVRGIIGKLLFGRGHGFTTFFIPTANLAQAQLVPHINLVAVDSLTQLHRYLTTDGLPIRQTGSGSQVHAIAASGSTAWSEVVGQLQAKRALLIAAGGGHNILITGPPGAGKTMLAKAAASILPPLHNEEILEVTHLHSLASRSYEQIMVKRPYRAPHHSASHLALVGGGARLHPGEISLAHRGVLFLDELPEFKRATIEALRQPLEERIINLVRADSSASFPANFMLIATANPCPCGYFGSRQQACECDGYQRKRYRNRLSGPILDRIDLFVTATAVEHHKILSQKADPLTDAAMRQSVIDARNCQAVRFGKRSKLNSDMTNADIRQFCKLGPAALTMLNTSASSHQISARSYLRILKISRTIADLEGSVDIKQRHIAQAFRFRNETNDSDAA